MLGLPLIWVASGRKVWLCVAVVTTRYSHQEATKTLRGHICIKFDVLRCCDFEADSDRVSRNRSSSAKTAPAISWKAAVTARTRRTARVIVFPPFELCQKANASRTCLSKHDGVCPRCQQAMSFVRTEIRPTEKSCSDSCFAKAKPASRLGYVSGATISLPISTIALRPPIQATAPEVSDGRRHNRPLNRQGRGGVDQRTRRVIWTD